MTGGLNTRVEFIRPINLVLDDYGWLNEFSPTGFYTQQFVIPVRYSGLDPAQAEI
jgi:hypothetical protein